MMFTRDLTSCKFAGDEIEILKCFFLEINEKPVSIIMNKTTDKQNKENEKKSNFIKVPKIDVECK